MLDSLLDSADDVGGTGRVLLQLCGSSNNSLGARETGDHEEEVQIQGARRKEGFWWMGRIAGMKGLYSSKNWSAKPASIYVSSFSYWPICTSHAPDHFSL